MEKAGQRKFKKGGARDQEFDQKIIDLARVTRVMAGGKRMRFRACVAIGDKKGRLGVGLAKGADVTLAVNKAVNKAKKQMVTIPIVNETIPHNIRYKFKAAQILMKPAPRGTGIKAGGAIRVMFELAGVPNVVAKILGTNNKITNVRAFMLAIQCFKEEAMKPRNKEVKKQKSEISETSKTSEISETSETSEISKTSETS
ncbi:MAG: 30S ribosomal protein S5, partial [Patescibacteria group bacterium]